MILNNSSVVNAAVGIPRASGGDPPTRTADPVKYAVFPAQAGVILCCAIRGILYERIPRASGGDPSTADRRGGERVYSPRKRG